MASERDPHNIIPDEFWEEFGSIEAARSAPSTTDEREQKRCPECESVNILKKAGQPADHPEHRRDFDFRCARCGFHFDEPKPPVVEIEEEGGADSCS